VLLGVVRVRVDRVLVHRQEGEPGAVRLADRSPGPVADDLADPELLEVTSVGQRASSWEPRRVSARRDRPPSRAVAPGRAARRARAARRRCPSPPPGGARRRGSSARPGTPPGGRSPRAPAPPPPCRRPPPPRRRPP